MNPVDDLAPDSRDDPTVDSRNDPAAERLAEGFAQHIERWARRLGCDETHLPVLRLAAYETSLATSNGHVCITLADVAVTPSPSGEGRGGGHAHSQSKNREVSPFLRPRRHPRLPTPPAP